MSWSTSSKAELMAKEQSNAAVVLALMPYRLAKAEQDPDGAAELEEDEIARRGRGACEAC